MGGPHKKELGLRRPASIVISRNLKKREKWHLPKDGREIGFRAQTKKLELPPPQENKYQDEGDSSFFIFEKTAAELRSAYE